MGFGINQPYGPPLNWSDAIYPTKGTPVKMPKIDILAMRCDLNALLPSVMFLKLSGSNGLGPSKVLVLIS